MKRPKTPNRASRRAIFGMLVLSILLTTVIMFGTVISEEEMYTSFGVSNLAADKLIELGETYNVDVAMISNTGDFTMNVTSTWIPKNSSGNPTYIMVNILPKWVVLYPEDSGKKFSQIIKVEVKAVEVGTYVGNIDFHCDVFLPDNYTGNPSTPGGTATATFTVPQPINPIVPKKKPPQNIFNNPNWLYGALTVVLFTVGLLLYLNRASVTRWIRKEGKDDATR